jgi:hypothetical protein
MVPDWNSESSKLVPHFWVPALVAWCLDLIWRLLSLRLKILSTNLIILLATLFSPLASFVRRRSSLLRACRHSFPTCLGEDMVRSEMVGVIYERTSASIKILGTGSSVIWNEYAVTLPLDAQPNRRKNGWRWPIRLHPTWSIEINTSLM